MTESLETMADKYERIKQQNRERQQRYYKNHTEAILLKKQEKRILVRELLKNQPPPSSPPDAPAPIEQPVFNNLSKEQLKKIVTTSNSQTNLKEILDRFRSFSLSGSKQTYTTYSTQVKQLYTLTGTHVTKAINLNNVKLIFDKLDKYKKPDGSDYGIDKLFLMVQVILILSDPENNFKLGVNKEVFNIYKSKYNEFKILKGKKQERSQEQEVPRFTSIISKAKQQLGVDSTFYLYLKLYATAPLRDNFQLLIIESSRLATKKSENYIVVPSNKKGTAYLIFNTYKTEGRYEQLKYPIPDDTLKLVRKYMVTNKINTGDYLLGSNKLSVWVGKSLKQLGITDYSGNINLLRHAVVSEFHSNNKNLTAKEQLDFALSLAHSPDMNKLYLRKIANL